MPFFNSRKRLQNLAAEEAKGVSFWTSDFSVEARVKVLFAANRAVAAPERQRVFEGARQLLREDEGWLRLPVRGRQEVDDIAAFVGTCEDKYLPSAIEAYSQAAPKRTVTIRTEVGYSITGYSRTASTGCSVSSASASNSSAGS